MNRKEDERVDTADDFLDFYYKERAEAKAQIRKLEKWVKDLETAIEQMHEVKYNKQRREGGADRDRFSRTVATGTRVQKT